MLSRSSLRNPKTVPAAALIAVVLFAFAPVLRAGFLWDDFGLVTQNRLIRDTNGLWQFWFTTKPPDYFPLTSTTWWIEWRLWGMYPAGYHAVNLLLHACSAVLIWHILLEIELPGAWLAAAIWAVHPVQVESVAWIAERKNTLSIALAAMSMLLFLRYLKAELATDGAQIDTDAEKKRNEFHLCSSDFGELSRAVPHLWLKLFLPALLTFTAALLAKTAVAPLPVVMLICAHRYGRTWRHAIRETVPFFVITAALSAVTIFFQSQRAIAADVVRNDGLPSRIAIAGRAVWFYLGKLLWPTPLSFVYPRWPIGDVSLRAFVPLVLLTLMFGVLWIGRRRWGALPLLAMGYFVLMLLPVLGLINIYFMRYSLVADHWQYAASLGPIALFAAIVSRAKIQLQWLIGALVLLPLIVLTDRQAMLYHTGESLWRDTMAKSPDSWMVYTNLGRVLDSQGRAAEAVQYHEAALRLAPELPDTHENVALGRILQGRYDQAEAEFHRALAIDPHFVPALTDLAKLELFDRHNPAEAEHYFRLALHDSPMFGPANYGYGVLLEQQGKLDQAADHYRLATQDSPDDFDAAYDLGSVLLKLNRPSEAIDPLRTAVRLQPNSQRAWTNLRAAYATSGQLDAATEAAREEMRVLSNPNP